MQITKNITIISLLLLILSACSNNGEVTPLYKYNGVKHSNYYSVIANHDTIPLVYSPIAPIAIFTMIDVADIEILTEGNIHKAQILPEHLNINVKIKNGRVKFQIKEPITCYLQINDNHVYPLVIMAQPKEQDINIDNTTLYYEGGKVHNIGDVILKDDAIVHIAQGAYVKGRFLAKDASNITIKGLGILDGSSFPSKSKKEAILFQNCNNIIIKDITSIDPAQCNIVLAGCNKVEINNFKAFGSRERRMSDDGIVIRGSSNITASNLFINTRNNCVAIQSSSKFGTEVSNISVSNSVLWKGDYGNVMEIGYLSKNLKANNIKFTNIDVIHCLGEAVFNIQPKHAQISNLTFSDIRLRDIRFLIWRVVLKHPSDQLRNILFKNISIKNSPIPYSDIIINNGSIIDFKIQKFMINGTAINDANSGHFRNCDNEVTFRRK